MASMCMMHGVALCMKKAVHKFAHMVRTCAGMRMQRTTLHGLLSLRTWGSSMQTSCALHFMTLQATSPDKRCTAHAFG